jgi:hypothetical protein
VSLRPCLYATQSRGLVFSKTVTNRIICITLEQYVRKIPVHPQVERIVQKEVGQEGADDPTLQRPSLSPDEAPIRHLHRAFSHLSMYKSAYGQSVCLRTARISSSVSMPSQSRRQHRCRAMPTASSADLPGRYP